jgi:hypothetical protein
VACDSGEEYEIRDSDEDVESVPVKTGSLG